MKRKLAVHCLLFIISLSGFIACSGPSDTIDLSGTWDFRIDSLDRGITEKWFASKPGDQVQLPGSMLTNGKGNDITVQTRWTGGHWDSTWYKSPEFAKYRQPGNIKISFWLQPLKHYVGVAWYQKKVTIPSDWKNDYIELFLERCHWETTLWVDSQKTGMQNALGAPHIYDLSKVLTPGEHTLTLRIDNRIKDINPGRDAHSLSDNTQTNWNGIIGKMTLSRRPAIYISDVQLYPDTDKKLVRAVITINNLLQKEADYQLTLSAFLSGSEKKQELAPLTETIHLNGDTTVVDLEYPMGGSFLLWDEFTPNVYTLTTAINGEAGRDSRNTDFGMKKFGTRGKQFYVNGRPVFLRGTLECAIFPKTGYPPTDVKSWERIYKKCKEYGLNHVRFHSWCPPEAAFIAADRLGIYLSVESSAWVWGLGNGGGIDKYLYEESERIVKNFGNHPSFCLMPYGNEANGNNAVPYLKKFVQYWKAKDDRRLYTSASGFPEIEESEYNSSVPPRIQWWMAGLNSPINANPPTTDFDWAQYLAKDKPTISHEIGQWCVYPNFKEISKYDGVLKPKNFEIFRDRLEANGMGQLADSFLLASGKLQVLCYKAELEAAFRTPDFGGFQLLDLHDFPGQGTALVGVLDPFWDEKGYVTAREYTRFCNTTVPLLRMKRMIYRNNEEFSARAELAHYGKEPLRNSAPAWKLTRASGDIVAEGKFPVSDISYGITALGEIKIDLSAVTKPEQLKITVSAGGYENDWNIWVYPAALPPIPDEQQIKVTQVVDQSTIDFLQQGGSVLLTVKKGSVKPDKGGKVPVGFSSVFWNTQWTRFQQPPFTLGILCKPDHPALSAFPTEYHSNWQWWDAMSHCNAIRLDSVDKRIQPIVRIIDDWFTARPLGLIFECKVGKGKLLVSGIDLITDIKNRYEAGQLLYSLKKYMSSNAFNPMVEVEVRKIKSLLR